MCRPPKHHRHRWPFLYAGQHGVADFLRFHALAECSGRKGLPFASASRKLGHLMHKRVRNQPVILEPTPAHMRMIAVGHVNAPPPAQWPFVTMVGTIAADAVTVTPTQSKYFADCFSNV